jgi:subtilase family serine protease
MNEPSETDADDDAPASRSEAATAAPTGAASPKTVGLGEVCRHPALTGRRECDAIVRADAARLARGEGCNRTVPYCASDLQAAYGMTQLARSAGKGAIVGVVDAYGYPNAASDLGVYRKRMGLPACALSSGCLRIVNQSGRTGPLPKPNADANDDWRSDEALDLDMVSALCPNCRILLVQANSNRTSDLAVGVNAAVGLGAVAVSNSYSGPEENSVNASYRRAGRAITASAGDSGSGARAPCSYASVVCVGGTSLLATASGRGWSERAWSDGGNGCSAYVGKPPWQHYTGCTTRSEVDLSAVGDPATGVAVYDSSRGGWEQVGGTSVGAALLAALFALGPNAARANAAQWIWRHGRSAFRHVSTRGAYDASTGWGTPQGVTGL